MKLQEILSLCRKPGRYIGREKNAFHKSWDAADIRAACVFPDLYEIGMSHLGLQILYDIINRESRAMSDRAFCPDTDLEKHMRRYALPLFGLETRRPLSSFDCLLITLPYELCYSNIFTILDLAGIPLWQKDRFPGRWPVVVGGGSCCLNPEPVADLFDAIVIGDGEETVIEILGAIGNWKRHGNRKDLLERLSGIPGVYVPALYRPVYGAERRFEGMETKGCAPGKVKRRVLPRLGPLSFPERPLVPNVQVVHDRLGVEIARGCTRGCRYCQASTIYRPVREREMRDVLSLVENGLRATGWEEISLLSLSTGDYSAVGPLIKRLMDRYVSRNISVSLPSLRVGTLTPDIMEQIRRVRKTGFTLAPEAGSDRLRKVINKGITEDALLDTAAQISARGWNSVKLYFMIGLPTETDDDVHEIVNLAKKVLDAISGSKGRRKGARVTLSVGTFVPKPHTPFQWEGQISVDESRRRLEIIRDGLRGRRFKVKWHNPVQSFLEGVFSRGDRKLSALVFRAWQMGARLDAWTDNLRSECYIRAAEELGIALDTYLDSLPEDAALPWDHIDSGVKKAFFRLERKRAFKHEYTPDCRDNECQGCGVCDFEKIKPVLAGIPSGRDDSAQDQTEKKDTDQLLFCRVSFSKLFDARFLGHLDMVRMFLRAVRRAGLPVSYSKGFHPMPRVSFSQPLPLGIESLSEEAVLVLEKEIAADGLVRGLNMELPLDIRVQSAEISRKRFKIASGTGESFLILLRGISFARAGEKVASFLKTDRFSLEVEKKGRKIPVDLTERVTGLLCLTLEGLEDEGQRRWAEKVVTEVSPDDNSFLRLDLLQEPPPHLKAAAVLAGIFDLKAEDLALFRILRL